MIYGIEDCTAMSEDGHWFAFDKSIPRGRVMAIMAESCGGWSDALHFYKVRAGFIRKVPAPDGSDATWHIECSADDDGAFPVWTVRS